MESIKIDPFKIHSFHARYQWKTWDYHDICRQVLVLEVEEDSNLHLASKKFARISYEFEELDYNNGPFELKLQDSIITSFCKKDYIYSYYETLQEAKEAAEELLKQAYKNYGEHLKVDIIVEEIKKGNK